MLQIGKVIAEKRKQKSVTQEQLAQAVGVSAPAVSKWESGQSYPDITLLPTLARYLGCSVDELLGYQLQLTAQQVLELQRKCARAFETEPFPQALEFWQGCLREYPNSQYLKFRLGNMAIQYLPSAETEEQRERFIAECVRALEEASGMEDQRLSDACCLSLSSFYLMRGEHDRALAALERLPEPQENIRLLKASVLEAKGEHNKAKKLNQECLYSAIQEISLLLSTLAGMEVREGRQRQAAEWLEKTIDFFHALDAPDRISSMLYLTLARIYAEFKNKERTIYYLERYIGCIQEWNACGTLFSLLEWTAPVVSTAYVQKAQMVLLEDVGFDFIRTEPSFEQLVKRLEDAK